MHGVALEEARRSGELLPDWLRRFVTEQLRELDDERAAAWPDEEWLEEEYGQLLRLPRQR